MSRYVPTSDTNGSRSDREILEERRIRYRRVARLLDEWMEDDSGYDEAIWPLIEEELNLPAYRHEKGS